MENGNSLIKLFFFRRGIFIVITLLVIVFLFSRAVEAKIDDTKFEEIKTVLEITNFPFLDQYTPEQLKQVLNKLIKPKESEVTYGILIQDAFSEMEFMDAVLSQAFLDRNRAYFDSVLDKRIDLFNYWKKTGQNMYKIWQKGGSATPVTALALESIEIVNKTMAIFEALKVLEDTKKYIGLWYYFDLRKQGNESHQVAWREAEEVMGFVVKKTDFLGTGQNRKDNNLQIEQQFAALYEKWGPYAMPDGISKEYKKQLAGELRNTLAAALEEHTEDGPLYANEGLLWDKFSAQLAKIKNVLASLVSQANPFKAGPIVELPVEIPAKAESPQTNLTEDGPLQSDILNQESAEVEPTQNELPEPELAVATTEADEATPDKSEPELAEPSAESSPAEENEEPAVEVGPPLNGGLLTTTEIVDEEIMEVGPPLPPLIELCQRGVAGTPRQYRVLINEVAWMGSQNSPNEEWIELKNIWGIPINLAGWQLQDKDQQIKIIFGENDVIQASGYFLLERSKDYTGALNNIDEALYLFDDQCQLEDEVLASPNWPAGDNALKKSMQRFNIFYWYTGLSTAGSENTSPPAVYTRPGATTPLPPPPPPTYPKILITETSIESPGNQKDDFVELYNPNSEAVSLTDWYIQRKTETGQDFSSYAPASLFAGKTIGAKSYFLIANASSSLFVELIDATTTYPLTENNTLVLKNPNRDIVDQVLTDNPSLSKSYGREWASTSQNYTDNFEVQIPTPKAQNQSLGNEDGEEEGGEISYLSVVFNEIAWAGNAADYSADEWLELFNNTSSTIELTGLKIKKDNADWIIFSTSTIPGKGYFLIERTTDDNTVSDIAADYFFTGALSNDGEKLELRDAAGNLIDLVDASEGWFAGQASPTYLSMERINSNASGTDPVNWASNNRVTRNGLDVEGNKINGTPKAENSVSKSSTIFTGDLIISDEFTLMKLGSPYTWQGSIIVNEEAQLIVESGVEIKFKHGGQHSSHSQLKVKGILEAQNATFTSYQEDQPWDGLYFENSTSTLDNVTINYAGKLHKSCCYEYGPYAYGAVYIDGGKLTIKNSFIKNSQTMGVWLKNSTSTLIDGVEFSYIDGDWQKTAAIYIENGSSTIQNSIFKNNNIGILVENLAAPIIENNTFEENQAPIKISNLLSSISGNTVQNNNLNGILLTGFGFTDEISQINWQTAGLPYILESSATVPAGATLNIEPDVIVKLKSGGRIYIEGNLQTFGQKDNRIIFTALADDEYGGDTNNNGFSTSTSGSWNFISFSASSNNSILDYVIVRYGGWYNVFQGGSDAKSGAIKVKDGPLKIKNSLIENNLFAGLYLINSTSTIENTIFKDHTAKYGQIGYSDSAAIYLENSTTTLNNVTFVNNSIDIFP